MRDNLDLQELWADIDFIRSQHRFLRNRTFIILLIVLIVYAWIWSQSNGLTAILGYEIYNAFWNLTVATFPLVIFSIAMFTYFTPIVRFRKEELERKKEYFEKFVIDEELPNIQETKESLSSIGVNIFRVGALSVLVGIVANSDVLTWLALCVMFIVINTDSFLKYLATENLEPLHKTYIRK